MVVSSLMNELPATTACDEDDNVLTNKGASGNRRFAMDNDNGLSILFLANRSVVDDAVEHLWLQEPEKITLMVEVCDALMRSEESALVEGCIKF